MLMRVKTAVVSAVFLAGAVGIAHAQGAITQDPGELAPRNLTLQYLGSSGAGVTIPGEHHSRLLTLSFTAPRLPAVQEGILAARTDGSGGIGPEIRAG